MTTAPPTERRTRLICLAERALTDGFALLGFETWPDPTAAQLDRLLGELLQARDNALLIIDHRLADSGSRLLPRIHAEGGRILVVEVPPLANPGDFRLDIDAQIRSLLGGQSLEDD